MNMQKGDKSKEQLALEMESDFRLMLMMIKQEKDVVSTEKCSGSPCSVQTQMFS